jgi:DNA-binding NtrC family response regulator
MGGSMTRISEYTGLERTHLYRKLKALGVDATKSKGEVAPESVPAKQ